MGEVVVDEEEEEDAAFPSPDIQASVNPIAISRSWDWRDDITDLDTRVS